MEWLGWLKPCPLHQKVVGSAPGGLLMVGRPPCPRLLLVEVAFLRPPQEEDVLWKASSMTGIKGVPFQGLISSILPGKSPVLSSAAGESELLPEGFAPCSSPSQSSIPSFAHVEFAWASRATWWTGAGHRTSKCKEAGGSKSKTARILVWGF